MQRRRYEILLPLRFNDDKPVPEELFNETRKELLAHFGGLSWVPHPVQGMWTHEEVTYADATIRIVVDVEDLAEHRQFFTAYKPVLMERFDQLEIYLISGSSGFRVGDF